MHPVAAPVCLPHLASALPAGPVRRCLSPVGRTGIVTGARQAGDVGHSVPTVGGYPLRMIGSSRTDGLAGSTADRNVGCGNTLLHKERLARR